VTGAITRTIELFEGLSIVFVRTRNRTRSASPEARGR